MSEAIGPGSDLGPYRIIKPLGRGPLGIVYSARQESLQRDVALKVLSPALSADAALVSRLGHEIGAVASLRQSHVATLYDCAESAGVYYIASELIVGVPVNKIKLPATPTAVLQLLKQLCQALEAAHARGATHHDLKPENILVNRTGQGFITDFGMARVLGPAAMAGPAAASTAKFTSPELARGEKGSIASDLYSLGLVAFYMLTGTAAFEGDNPLATLYRQMQDPLPGLPDSVPANLADWIERCCEKDPAARFSSPAAAAAALLPGAKVRADPVPVKQPAPASVLVSFNGPAAPVNGPAAPVDFSVTESSATIVAPGSSPLTGQGLSGPLTGQGVSGPLTGQGAEVTTTTPALAKPLSPFEKDQVDALLREASINLKRGNADAAREASTRIQEIDPGNLEVHAILGQLLEAKGQDFAAYREYKIACQSGDPNSEAQILLAQLLVRIPPGSLAMLQPSKTASKDLLPAGLEDRLPAEALAMLRAADTVRPVPPSIIHTGISMATLLVPGVPQMLDDEYSKGGILLLIWLGCAFNLSGQLSVMYSRHHLDLKDPLLWGVVGILLIDYVVSFLDFLAARRTVKYDL